MVAMMQLDFVVIIEDFKDSVVEILPNVHRFRTTVTTLTEHMSFGMELYVIW